MSSISKYLTDTLFHYRQHLQKLKRKDPEAPATPSKAEKATAGTPKKTPGRKRKVAQILEDQDQEGGDKANAKKTKQQYANSPLFSHIY